MPNQEHVRRHGGEADVDADATTTAGVAEDHKDDVDALLDEIDDVLEANAEEFVASFVQKGGQ